MPRRQQYVLDMRRYDARRFDRVMRDLISGKPPRPDTPHPTPLQQRTVAIFAVVLGNSHGDSHDDASRFADVVEALNPSWPVLARIWALKTRGAPWNSGFVFELDVYQRA